ncbi:hypothetical protein KI387_002754, partial [Taxus chinensis]
YFIAVFETPEDRDLIFSQHWVWGEHGLMSKPWYPSFDPLKESFDTYPIWVRLPGLPLQLWNRSCLIAIGDTLGSCVAVDDKTSIQTHTTYARILVDLDTSKCLPAEINLQIGARLWVQRIDYERLAFRCRRCFQTGHVTDDCEHSKRKTKTAWWRDSLPEHLTIDSNPAKDSSAPLQANLTHH